MDNMKLNFAYSIYTFYCTTPLIHNMHDFSLCVESVIISYYPAMPYCVYFIELGTLFCTGWSKPTASMAVADQLFHKSTLHINVFCICWHLTTKTPNKTEASLLPVSQ